MKSFLNTSRWEDLRFPARPGNIDSAAARYSYDHFNGSIVLNGTVPSRYPEEWVSYISQMPHGWLEEYIK